MSSPDPADEEPAGALVAKSGPAVPAVREGEAAGSLATSCDAFYGGRFHLLQPKGRGFRAGLDALLLAAAIPADASGRAADIGSGSGAASFALACRCPGLAVRLVERNPAVADLARAGAALDANRGISSRLAVTEADILGGRAAREAAGLPDGGFDVVLTNPPFYPEAYRRSPDPLRAEALAMAGEDFLARWVRAAAALLRPQGWFAMIARPESLAEIAVAARNRLGDLRVMPVHPRADRPAIRVLIRARKGSRAPLSLMPPLVLHGEEGELTEAARRIAAGEAELGFGA